MILGRLRTGLLAFVLLTPFGALAAYGSAFISQSVPVVMVPGQTYPVSITLRNSDTWGWTSPVVTLGSQHPQDNIIWGLNRVTLPDYVAPATEVTINFNVTAPATPGVYNFQWRMVSTSTGWFGAYTPNVTVRVGLNDALYVSQVVPPVMAPGQTYPVSVTMRNNGGSTWSPGGNYSIGSQNAQNNTLWGLNRVAVPNSVAPGQDVTFTFNVTAPATSGTYNFQWRMVQDGVGWFGLQSTNVAVRDGLDNAQFISQDVPSIMTPGQSYDLSVTMRNTGSTTWSGTTVALGSTNPENNLIWGFNRVPLANDVPPGSDATFEFTVTAPSSTGTYNLQWRMAEGALGWFGQNTTNVAVQNGLDNAQFVSQTVPPAMVPGQTYSVSVTMQNTGSTTWSSGASYQLGSQNPQDNTVWGLSRVTLPSSVAPGTSVTFNFDVVAPSASGPYNFQWRLLQGASNWFGSSSANATVNVGGAQANIFFIETDHLDTPRLVADATGTSVWRWDQQEPFGVNVPDENPSGLGSFDLPLRFAGQRYDAETGLHYNYYRDFDAILGIYKQSDPIGLRGGLNTYNYVASRPLFFTDRAGLCPWCAAGAAAGDAAAGGAATAGGAASSRGSQSKRRDASGFGDDLFPEANKRPGPVWPEWLRWPNWMNSEAADEAKQCPVPVPDDPTQAPGPDWEWRGKGEPGSDKGSWYNPGTDESMHPDLNHPDPIGPHWDYTDPSGKQWRVDPGSGMMTPK